MNTEINNILYIFKSCMIMSRDVENDDEEVDTEHEKRKRRVFYINNLFKIKSRK